MKKYRTPVVAFVVFIVAVLFIANHRSFHFFLPAQQVELSHGVEYGAVLKDFLFVQEIAMQKRYISRIDLYMAKLPSRYTNENVFLLLDEQHRILFTKRFSSADFGEALYFPFDFGKTFDIGIGKKIYACVHSIDGDQGSYVGLARKENSNLGKLYVVSIANNDIVQSFEKQQGLVNFSGSIGARTFETDTRFFSLLQIVFYILSGGIALLLLFRKQIASFIRRFRIRPEYAFLVYSMIFGLIFLLITPPFMVPDEPAHFYRAYQISEFNIYKLKDDFPKSLVDLGAICDRMQFSTHEKTSRKEILSLGSIQADPAVRTSKVTPDYTLPYLPQAVGIAVGKISGLTPLWLFYFGRLVNLLISIALLFLAIRITPVFKWVFFLLGVMPMTLYQVASMSYDAVTIGLSFLLLATILSHALRDKKTITTREIAVLFILAILLAAAKQPYSIMVLTFLIIPVSRFGTLKRYMAVFAGLLLAVVVVSQLWVPGRMVFKKFSAVNSRVSGMAMKSDGIPGPGEEIVTRNVRNPMLPMLPHFPETMNAALEQAEQTPAGVKENQQPQPDDATRVNPQIPVNPIDPVSQKEFIIHNPVKYTGILFHTLEKSLPLYLTSFVGLFGWIDAPIPPLIAYSYLVLLVLFSVACAMKGKGIGFRGKGLISGVFITGFVLIETALYVYCNPVGCDPITAVQGRYFIAIAPLFFLLFLNTSFPGFMHRIFNPPLKKPAGKKQQQKHTIIAASPEDMLLTHALPWIAMLAVLITLTCSVFVILERFYVIAL